MKKITLLNAVVALLMIVPSVSQAQNIKSMLGNVLSSAKSSTAGTSSSSSIFNFLTGKKAVTSKNLIGTWTYSEPAAAFESQNLLSEAGGALVAQTVQSKSGSYLSRYGIKPGAMKFTFKNDTAFSCVVGGKTIRGTYKVNGSTVNFYKGGIKALSANANLKGSNMQLTFKADKLLSLVKMLNYLPSSDAALGVVTKLASNYNGMQVGMQFKK